MIADARSIVAVMLILASASLLGTYGGAALAMWKAALWGTP